MKVASPRRVRYKVTKRPAPTRPTSLVLDPVRLEASLCRQSLYDFVQRFWHTVESAKPVWNWHIEVLCLELQQAMERVFRGEPKLHDLVINVPPGSTKSLICSVLFPAWCWTRMKETKIISVSHDAALSLSFSRRSRIVVESEKWTKLFGKIDLADDQNAKSHYENGAGGWRYAVGMDGNVTGRHGHVTIIDDPINPKVATSEVELKGANNYIRETLPSRKVDKEVSLTIIIMQRLHQNDPSAMLLEESRRPDGTPVRHICLPGEITGTGFDQVKPRKYAKLYKDGLLDPVRLNRKVLREFRSMLLEYGYAGQILQTPVPPGGGQFKVERLVVDTPEPLRHFKQIIRFWDKAGTPKGGAWTVGLLMGLDRFGAFWVLDVVRGQWDSATRERTIKTTAILDGHKVIVGVEQEPGSGGKESAENTVKMLAGYRVRVDRPSGDKVVRADPFSVQVNAGNVKLAKADWNKVYVDEMRHFPHSTYKDQIDASSGAFALLTKHKTKVGALWSSK